MLHSPKRGPNRLGLPPPQCIQTSTPQSAQQKIILGMPWNRIPALQVAKPACVALERGEEMIPVPGNLIAKKIGGWTPIKAVVVSGDMNKESIQWMGCVTSPVPNTKAWTPAPPGGRKVGAKQAVHLPAAVATSFAVPAPVPEREGGT
jgi:hypothetical protein